MTRNQILSYVITLLSGALLICPFVAYLMRELREWRDSSLFRYDRLKEQDAEIKDLKRRLANIKKEAGL